MKPPSMPTVTCDRHMILLGNHICVYFLMNTFVFCCFFSVLLRMGLCVQLVCDIIMYQLYYNKLSVLLLPTFSKNDGLDFLWKRLKGVGFVIWE